jgi:membrane protein DedA with SNARE-associated domain
LSPPAPFVDAPPALRKAALFAFGVMFALTAVTAAFSPWLLVHSPLGLMVLSPDSRHLVLAAPSLSLGVFLVAGVGRRGFSLSVTYLLAGIYGPAAVAWAQERSPRAAGYVRFVERLFAKVGPPLLVLLPTYSVSAVAGVAGTRPAVFFGASTLGQVLWLGALHRFGDVLSVWTEPLVAWLSENLWESTAVCVALVVVWQAVAYMKRRRRTGGALPADLAADLNGGLGD